MFFLPEFAEGIVILICTALIFYQIFQFLQSQPILTDSNRCIQYGVDGKQPKTAPPGPDGSLRKPSSYEHTQAIMMQLRWETERKQAIAVHYFILISLVIIMVFEIYMLITTGDWYIHAFIAIGAFLSFASEYKSTFPKFPMHLNFPITKDNQCPSEFFQHSDIMKIAKEIQNNKSLQGKMRFILHPDKNLGCIQSATEKFNVFKEALPSKIL